MSKKNSLTQQKKFPHSVSYPSWRILRRKSVSYLPLS